MNHPSPNEISQNAYLHKKNHMKTITSSKKYFYLLDIPYTYFLSIYSTPLHFTTSPVEHLVTYASNTSEIYIMYQTHFNYIPRCLWLSLMGHQERRGKDKYTRGHSQFREENHSSSSKYVFSKISWVGLNGRWGSRGEESISHVRGSKHFRKMH